MVKINKTLPYEFIVVLAIAIFLPPTAFAALFDKVERIGDASGKINIYKFSESTRKLSNINFRLVTPSPIIEKRRKKNRVPQSILLAEKKGRDKFSIGLQRSSKGKYYDDKVANSSASSSYQITSNGKQTHTLTRQGVQMQSIPGEEVESIREFTEIVVGHSDYMIALQEAQGILDAVAEGSVLGEFSGDMNSGVGSEFLPEDNDSLLNRGAVGKKLTNKYDSFGSGPGGSIDNLRATAGVGKGKAGDFGVKDALGGVATIGAEVAGTSLLGLGFTVLGVGLFFDQVYHSLPDPNKSSGQNFLEWLEEYPGMTEDEKNETRYKFYENSCKNNNQYCKEYNAEKKKSEEVAEPVCIGNGCDTSRPAPEGVDSGGAPERIELTKAQKDWWATILTTGWVPEESNPGPGGGKAGGFQLSPKEHAQVFQQLMILAEVPWSPTSGQPIPDQDYRNYQVANDGTITITDLTLAGQPLDDDDGSFGVKKQPKRLGGPKPVGGIDQVAPEDEPSQNPTGNRSNVPFPAPMK
jgi:hypothetical protein